MRIKQGQTEKQREPSKKAVCGLVRIKQGQTEKQRKPSKKAVCGLVRAKDIGRL